LFGLAVSIFIKFRKKNKHFVTVLRENQYNSTDDFEIPKGKRWRPYKKDPKTGKVIEEILDCNKTLIDSKTKQTYRVRTILVREVGSESFAVVATSIDRRIEPDAGKIVSKYKDRWDIQENSFKQMKPSLYLDTNHGTNVIEQEDNRVIRRKVEDLEKKIQAKKKKIESALNKIRKAEEQLNKLEQRINLDETVRKNTEQYKKHIIRREKILHSISAYRSTASTSELKLDDLARKLKDIDQTKILYEIDTRKDHIMTNLETALNNADIFVKEQYLPEQYRRSDFRTIRDILYRQQGRYYETKDEIRITLNHYDQEPEHQMLAEYASKKINDSQLKTNSGKRIIVQVANS